MRKIILASSSLQRKNLLKALDVPFDIKVSNAPEIKRIKTTCAALVKANALIKVQDVADRESKAIVIGADTVVYIGNKKIIGKPENKKDAKRILKILSSAPQWVYTGVAIVDTMRSKTLLGYEKTKVFMHQLSDEEIDRYHKKVNPLGKAGGFDIQGHGSIFLRRIEGCYSNVLGLPMAKLSLMLKELGVFLL